MGILLMHPYSVSSARWRKIGYLMLLAVFSAGYFQDSLVSLFSVLPFLNKNTVPPGLPTFSIFAIFYFFWNKYLWRFPLIQRFTTPPDLNGEWTGTIKSSHNQNAGPNLASDGGFETKEDPSEESPRMEIDQTWSSINVTIEFNSSYSLSTSAAFLMDYTDPVLRITYRNHPKGLSNGNLSIHEGTNDLRLQVSNNQYILSGNYYTDQHRDNYGVVKFSQPNDSHYLNFS